MRARCLVAIVGVLAVTMLVPAAAGQSGKWTPPRTPDGKPDLQGTFTFSTITPLQRPEALADKDILTPEEAAAFEASENIRLNRDLYDPEKGAPSAGYPPRSQGGVLSYNDFWYERGDKLTRRPAHVTHHRSPRRPHSVYGGVACAGRGAGSEEQRGTSTTPRGSQPRRPLHSRLQRRPADDFRHVQQQPADRPDTRLRRHLQRDGPRRADHPDRRPPARHSPAVDRRFKSAAGRATRSSSRPSISSVRPASPTSSRARASATNRKLPSRRAGEEMRDHPNDDCECRHRRGCRRRVFAGVAHAQGAKATINDPVGPPPDPTHIPTVLPKDIKWTGQEGRQQQGRCSAIPASLDSMASSSNGIRAISPSRIFTIRSGTRM